MKYHLNILLFVMQVVIGGTFLAVLVNLFAGAILIFKSNSEVFQKYSGSIFKPENAAIVPDNITYMGIATLLYAALLLYGAVGATRIYYCLNNIKNGGFFYETQSDEFKRAGANVVIFAKLKYLLFCIAGIFLYHTPSAMLSQIPSFITFYLIGKSLLVVNYVIQKGETIKHENDLTI